MPLITIAIAKIKIIRYFIVPLHLLAKDNLVCKMMEN